MQADNKVKAHCVHIITVKERIIEITCLFLKLNYELTLLEDLFSLNFQGGVCSLDGAACTLGLSFLSAS